MSHPPYYLRPHGDPIDDAVDAAFTEPDPIDAAVDAAFSDEPALPTAKPIQAAPPEPEPELPTATPIRAALPEPTTAPADPTAPARVSSAAKRDAMRLWTPPPMPADASGAFVPPLRPPEIRAAPEPGLLRRIGEAAIGTLGASEPLLAQRAHEMGLRSPEQKSERIAARVAAGNLKVEPDDDLEPGIPEHIGSLLGTLGSPSQIVTMSAPAVAGERATMEMIRFMARRGVPGAQLLLRAMKAPEGASVARRLGARAVHGAATGPAAAELITAQETVGHEGRLPTAGEAGQAAAAGVVLGAILGPAFELARIGLGWKWFPKETKPLGDDPYRVLGLDRNASMDDVEAAFRRKAKQYHPDVNKDPSAHEEMIRFTQAMADIRKRRAGETRRPRPTAESPAESPAAAREAPQTRDITPEERYLQGAVAPRPGEASAPPPAPKRGGLRQWLADRLDPNRKKEIERLDTERRSAERAAETDALTGLGNRAAFEKAKATADADPNVEWVVFDADNFKAKNDLQGHEAGDQFLRKVGMAIREAGGRGFRTGGDEFQIPVQVGKGESVRQFVEKRVGREPIKLADGRTVHVSVTGQVGPTHGAADAGLQSAKQERKGGQNYRDAMVNNMTGIVRRRTKDIRRDPARFQFKSLGEEGVSNELKGVDKYNEKLAGVATLWTDPADGLDYVINGHHRHELSERTGNEYMNVQYIDAKDAQEARAWGAFINMAEGRGTAIDAGKFFRDMQAGPRELEARGVSLRGDIVRDGLALARLAPELFDQVATQKIPQSWGVAIGQLVDDFELQRQAMQIARAEKRLSPSEVTEIARQVRDAGTEELTQETLFGTQTDRKALFVPKAKLANAIKKRLSGDKRLFGFVSKSGRAEQLSQAGDTRIDVQAAREIADVSARIEEVFDRLYTRTGPIADLINEGARRIARGEQPGTVAADLYPAVGDAVGREIQGGEAQPAGSDGGERALPERPRSVADEVADQQAARDARVADSQDAGQSSFLTSEGEGEPTEVVPSPETIEEAERQFARLGAIAPDADNAMVSAARGIVGGDELRRLATERAAKRGDDAPTAKDMVVAAQKVVADRFAEVKAFVARSKKLAERTRAAAETDPVVGHIAPPPEKPVPRKAMYAAMELASEKLDDGEMAAPTTPDRQLEDRTDEDIYESGGTFKALHGGTGEVSRNRPLFLTTSREGAEWYAEERGKKTPTIITMEVTIDAPARVADVRDAAEAVGVTSDDVPEHSFYDGTNDLDLIFVPKVREELERRGFDGVIDWDVLERFEILAAVPLMKTGQVSEISRVGGQREKDYGEFDWKATAPEDRAPDVSRSPLTSEASTLQPDEVDAVRPVSKGVKQGRETPSRQQGLELEPEPVAPTVPADLSQLSDIQLSDLYDQLDEAGAEVADLDRVGDAIDDRRDQRTRSQGIRDAEEYERRLAAGEKLPPLGPVGDEPVTDSEVLQVFRGMESDIARLRDRGATDEDIHKWVGSRLGEGGQSAHLPNRRWLDYKGGKNPRIHVGDKLPITDRPSVSGKKLAKRVRDVYGIRHPNAQETTYFEGLQRKAEALREQMKPLEEKVKQFSADDFQNMTETEQAPVNERERRRVHADLERLHEQLRDLAEQHRYPMGVAPPKGELPTEAREYIPESSGRSVTEEQKHTRDVARALGSGDYDGSVYPHVAQVEAAKEMAARIPPNAYLVPLPGHRGNTELNRQLANQIERLLPESDVLDVIQADKAESSRKLRQTGKPGLTVDEQAARMRVRKNLPNDGRPVVLIDNVETTGATGEGARRALGRPDAQLVTYAKAPVPSFEGGSAVPRIAPGEKPPQIPGKEATSEGTREVRESAPGSAAGESSRPVQRDERAGAGDDLFSGGEGRPGDESPAAGAGSESAGRGGDRPARAGAGAGSGDRSGESAGRVHGLDYHITATDAIGAGGAKAKARSNLEAIRLLKHIEGEARPATAAEQAVLVKYVGWGGLPGAFDTAHAEYGALATDLKALLTKDEYEAARASTPNAHYTSETVIGGIYDALARLGFTGGRVLEPSMGVGHFLGLMPTAMRNASKVSGVELDSITGRIGKLLYPRADIRVEGFEATKYQDGYFDVAVGNVPFGNYKVHDPRYNKHDFSIHDYFFAKSLDKVRPGGIVAFITSRYTLDRADPSVRKYFAERADFIGAIRLPNNAFKGNAGTEVTTDIIFLQRRAEGAPAAGEAFEKAVAQEGGWRLNEYFDRHSHMMLGTMEVGAGQFGEAEAGLVAPKTQDLGEAIAFGVRQLPTGVFKAVTGPTAVEKPRERVEAEVGAREGGYVERDGKVFVVENGAYVSAGVPANALPRVRDLITLRDRMRDALRTQTEDAAEDVILAARKRLNDTYDRFVKQHGPINKEVAAGKGVVRPNLKYFDDVDAPLLTSLENYDSETGKAQKAAIFTTRVIRRPAPPARADNGADALVISLDQRGKVDLDYIQQLTGKNRGQVLAELDGLVYEDPVTEVIETADAYLSGNVREKLALAQKAAKKDERYAANVSALEKVIPKDLVPSEIGVTLGASWVPVEDYEDFVVHLLGQPQYGRVKIAHFRAEATWSLEAPHDIEFSVRATKEFGTDRVNAVKLIDDALNQRQPTVYDRLADGTSIKNVNATIAAREKLEQVKTKFREWIFSDQKRAERLVRKYNDERNNLRVREFDGSHLTLPGASTTIKPHKHQLDAVWRIVQSGNTLLAHVVGAGKTFTMVMAGIEAKRLGVAQKPMFVVPNHMLGQFSREFLQMYPGARILVARKEDFQGDKRKAFVARIATGDWDGVVITHSTFGKVPVSEAFETNYINEQITLYDTAMQEVKAARGGRSMLKQIEKGKKRLEARLKELGARERKDDLLAFEELGIDMLFVDEADLFKNLDTPTKMERVSLPASQRASDLYLKTRYLEQINPGRGIVFATGTPISNSVSEMHIMQRYLASRALRGAGLEPFDAWAADFGETVTALELKPEGGGYRVNTRFAAFKNMPELTQMFRQFADVKTNDDLKLPLPRIKTGKAQVVKVPGSDELKAYLEELVHRAMLVRSRQVDETEDNMLKITGDGRRAALDIRMVGRGGDMPGNKLSLAADKIHEIWQRTKATKATQMVFSDLGTPGGAGFDVYAELKGKLIERGVPEKEVAFIHDAKTDKAKEALFASVRSGKVRVLLGSTEKMGAGTNVQKLLVAKHDLDAPWRPRDVEQRDGRIRRQGNSNEEIEIFRYITEGSFDAYNWQTLETKARFIDQAMTASSDLRRVEDVDSRALSFAEIKALASGNPEVMEKATIDAEVQKLSRLEASHRDNLFSVRQTIAGLPRQIKALQNALENVKADAERAEDTTGDKFAITLEGAQYTERAKAGDALRTILHRVHIHGTPGDNQTVGKFAGFLLEVASRGHKDPSVTVTIEGEAPHSVGISLDQSPIGMIQSLERLPKRLPDDVKHYEGRLAEEERNLVDARRIENEPFEHAEKLAKARAKQLELDERLTRKATQERTDQDRDVVLSKARQSLVARLVAVGEDKTELAGLTDSALIERAVSHGLVDDVTVSQFQQLLKPIEGEGGFLKLGRTPPPPPGPNQPRVFVDNLPPAVGLLESYLMPPSRVAKRMIHSKRGDIRALGAKLSALVDAGQAARLRFERFVSMADTRLDRITTGLNKTQREQLIDLADKYETVADLPASTPPILKDRFKIWRDGARDDWRALGENERVMLSKAKRSVLDLAIEEFPEGGKLPDFDNVPLNRRNLLAANDRMDGPYPVPTDRAGWVDLYDKLIEAKKRVQEPVFMDSPDLRRIFDMIQGRGGIMAYFPHVFKGDWVVRAGAQTKRFVDRDDAVDYARGLLERGEWTEDLLVQREGFSPDGALYLTRGAYRKLVDALANEVGEEAATVSKAVGGTVRIQPRKRWLAHLQKREVNLQTFERDITAALRTYHYRVAKKLAFDPFRKEGLEILESLPHEGGWRDWAGSYIADNQGVPGEFIESVNASLEGLGLGPWALQRLSGKWQGLMSWMYLGWSPVSAAVNLTQLAINAIPAFESAGEKWVARGLLEMLRGTDESKAVLDKLGIGLAHPKYLAAEYLPSGVQVNDQSWYMPMFLFNGAETINRSATALARYYQQRALGKSTAEAIADAGRFTQHVNFDYSMADAPKVMRNPVGRAFLQFKLFGINQLLFAEDLLRWGNNTQRARFMAFLMLFGGLTVLALQTPLAVLNWLSGKTGIFEDEQGERQTAWDEFVDRVLTEEGGELRPLQRFLKYGLFGLWGLSMSERVGFGGPREFNQTIPESKAAELAAAITAKSPSERITNWKKVLPSAIRRLLAWNTARTEGVIRDRYGRVVDDSVSMTDLWGQGLGIQTVEQAERSSRYGRELELKARYADRRADYMDKAATALREGGVEKALPVIREAKEHNVTITVAQVRARVKEQDQSDISRRVKGTPKDLRQELFTPGERREIIVPRQPPGAPRPPRRPSR